MAVTALRLHLSETALRPSLSVTVTALRLHLSEAALRSSALVAGQRVSRSFRYRCRSQVGQPDLFGPPSGTEARRATRRSNRRRPRRRCADAAAAGLLVSGATRRHRAELTIPA